MTYRFYGVCVWSVWLLLGCAGVQSPPKSHPEDRLAAVTDSDEDVAAEPDFDVADEPPIADALSEWRDAENAHEEAAMSAPVPAAEAPRRESRPSSTRKKAPIGLGDVDTGGVGSSAYGSGGSGTRGGSRSGSPSSAPRHAASPRPKAAPSAPALRAGRHDDNKQYNRFLTFLGKHPRDTPRPLDVSQRLQIEVVDQDERSIPHCAVRVATPKGQLVEELQTYADGRTHFFPSLHPNAGDDFVVRADCGFAKKSGQLSRAGVRSTRLRMEGKRRVPPKVPVDIAIVLDTTGSMGGQIDRLKATLRNIHFQLTNLETKPDIRFGLVAYRDRGDDYLTQVTPFTGDVQSFQAVLNRLDADGGGDIPEDLETALAHALSRLKWRQDALRLGFIIADAPPHTDYEDTVPYIASMRQSLNRAIKWTSVGAGGLPLAGEIVFRQIAQFTMGEYVFITQGGGGDHAGGVGEASHHVGGNYKVEDLDHAIVRIVRRELSYLTDNPRDFDDTIVAWAKPGVPKETVCLPAVDAILEQLVGYSAIQLASRTPVVVMPVHAASKDLAGIAEYLSDQLMLRASRQAVLQVLERDLDALSQEIKLQLSDAVDVEQSVPIGKMLGAWGIISARVVLNGDRAEIFAKLVRVETGEVLSVANAHIPLAIFNDS